MAILAQDSFERAVSGGWGTADLGGAWAGTAQYASSGRSVSGGRGILAPQNGWGGDMVLPVSVRDVAVGASYVLTAPLGLGLIYVGLKARVSGSSDYEVAALHSGSGTVDLVIYQDNADVLLKTVQMSLPAWNTVSKFWIKAEVFGDTPTTIRGKLWAEGTVEPDWQIAHEVAPSGTLGSGGRLGVEAFRDPGGSGSAAVSVAFDDYLAADYVDSPAANPRMYLGARPVAAMYLGAVPVELP